MHPILLRVWDDPVHERPSATTPRDGSRCRHRASVALRQHWHQEHPLEGATTRKPCRSEPGTGGSGVVDGVLGIPVAEIVLNELQIVAAVDNGAGLPHPYQPVHKVVGHSL